jgi:uncharacterized protein with PQ loop repeat
MSSESSSTSTTSSITKESSPSITDSSSTIDSVEDLNAALDSFAHDFATFLDQNHIVGPNGLSPPFLLLLIMAPNCFLFYYFLVKHIEQHTIESLLTRIDEFERLVNLVSFTHIKNECCCFYIYIFPLRKNQKISSDAARTRELLPPLLEKS